MREKYHLLQTYNPIGWTMADWVMNNHKSLKVMYVMWGQRIWDIRVDKHPKQWEDWPFQKPKDRGDVTQNHWFVNLVPPPPPPPPPKTKKTSRPQYFSFMPSSSS